MEFTYRTSTKLDVLKMCIVTLHLAQPGENPVEHFVMAIMNRIGYALPGN
jgi:hypothetical protein